MSPGYEEAAYVIGGSTPFGLAVARELVDLGSHVLLVGPELELLDQAVAELGERALPCVADLGDPADAARVGGVATALLGRVDGVLVDACRPPAGDLLAVTDEEWFITFRQIVRVPLAIVRGIVPLLEDEGGSIVFACESPTRKPGSAEGAEVFGAALAALVDGLARTLAPSIRVDRVEPAPELAHSAALLLGRSTAR